MKAISKLTVLWTLMLAPAAMAQPRIISILNAASYLPTGLPNSGIAQGSMFVVFGTGLGPSGFQQADGFPLPPKLGGTSIRVTVDTTVVDAIMVYTSATQAAAILPSNTPVGIGLLAVTYQGHTSQSGAFRIVRSAPGILTLNQAGTGPALAENFNSDTDQPRNALTRPAHPGQVVTLWGTGFGPMTGDDAAAPAHSDMNINLQVLVGGKAATIRYKGRAGCCAGIDQVVFEVPANIEGCNVPVAIRVDDSVSNFATIAIASTGGVCSSINGVSGADLEKLQGGGLIAFGSVSMNVYQDCGDDDFFCTSPTLIESGAAEFYRSGQGSVSPRLPLSLPSLGSCLVSVPNSAPSSPIGTFQQDPLDAGPALNFSGPKGTKQIPLQSAGRYFQQFATGATQIQFLAPGTYVVDNGPGGTDVGPFHATLTIPAVLTSTVDRSPAGVKVSWAGGDPAGYVTIQGSAVSPSNRASAVFVCSERVSAGQFTVPQEVILSLPVDSRNAPGLSVYVISPALITFRTPGLDVGVFSYSAFLQ